MRNFGKIVQPKLILSILLSLSVTACKENLTYAELVSTELARETSADELLLGLRFNMSMEEFFIYCFNMNQKGLFFQNSGNAEVLYTFKEEFSDPVDFMFFPTGGHPDIQKLEGTMVYKSWAPFTKVFTAEQLQEEVKNYLEDHYGGRPFIEIEHPLHYWPAAFVKVDANRKILLYRSFDDRKLHLVFENLRAKS